MCLWALVYQANPGGARPTQSDDGNFVVDGENCDVKVINRKRPMEGNRWGWGISMTTAIFRARLAIRDDEGDNVGHRIWTDLSS